MKFVGSCLPFMLNGKPIFEMTINTTYPLALFSCNYRHTHLSDCAPWEKRCSTSLTPAFKYCACNYRGADTDKKNNFLIGQVCKPLSGLQKGGMYSVNPSIDGA